MANNSLITGGYGLIGSELANSLEGNITILTRSDKNKDRVTKKGVRVLIQELKNLEKKDIESVDTIYHFASTVDNYNVLSNPYIDVETNINGTIHLLELCRDLRKKPKIVFLSTFFVYGNEYDRTKTPINENSKTGPLALYPATKLCAESIIKLYSRLYYIPYLILRLTNVYGEKEDYNNKKKGALNYLIMQAVKGKPLSIYRGGDFKRDYIYVTDVISAIKFLESKSIINDTYLVGFGEPVLFKDLIKYLNFITNKKSPIRTVNPPEFHKIVGIENFVADTSKIRKLGWKSTVDYKEGIKKIADKYTSLLLTP